VTQTSSFSSLPLSPEFLANLESLGYHNMTPIQAQSLPPILNRQDVIAQAKTGSGKTGAFGIGILHKIDPMRFYVQAMVVCPTRELADQVAHELRRLARFASNIKVLTLCGGAPIKPQKESLEHGAHIIVGTPGRLIDHIERNNIDLDRLQTLVLDEADRMVDMGFYDDIVRIAQACPDHRQTLLFSATYAEDIRKASARFLREPVEVRIEATHDISKIDQRFYEITREGRNAAVALLLDHYRPESTLAFCNTKALCRELVDELNARGFDALALHGDLEQREREEILVQFSNRSCSILVATDVAARGLDIQSLEAVINVDVTKDTEVHIHRIGRTGRAGNSGLALSLCAPHEVRWANLIETYQGKPLAWHDLSSLTPAAGRPARAPMVTLCIQGGKKDKLRPGDLMGALTGDAGLQAEQVGKINVFEYITYVALERSVATQAYERLSTGKIKGRVFRMRFMSRP
jgi:ATP-independent RNA helicase DbpA